MKFRNERTGKSQQKNQIKICKHAKRCNLRSLNVSRGLNASRLLLVFLSTLLSCSSRFLRASQQNNASLLVKENLWNSPVQFCPYPVYPGWHSHKCDPIVFVLFASSRHDWFPLHSSTFKWSQPEKGSHNYVKIAVNQPLLCWRLQARAAVNP